MSRMRGCAEVVKGTYSRLRWIISILAVWLVCVGLYVAVSVNISLKRATDELNDAGFLLHRLISQRVAQHDAHLTTLVSLILAGDGGQLQPLSQVSESIIHFYPRITAIQEIELAWREPPAATDVRQVLSVPENARVPDYAAIASAIFAQKAGEGKSYVSPSLGDNYLLTKKVKDTNPAFSIVLQIDPQRLVDLEEVPAWLTMRLQLDGTVVMERVTEHQGSSWLSPPVFSRMIDSRSQPLLLTMERPVSVFDLVDLVSLAVVAAISLAGLLLLGYIARQRREAQHLQATALLAEQRNALLARETRLAHAARVNSLGELASGIAHELAQPLTALMSQSRAAERLLEQAGIDNTLLKTALASNVREARRAGDMLKRMRDYISNRPPRPVAVEVNRVVTDTVELMRAELDKRHIVLQLDLGADLPLLMADPVELEQVFNNLIRNAADSLEHLNGAEPQITIETMRDGGWVRIDVSDNGPGIDETVLPHLFEPFFTTKKDGMGLGLALCSTLVERVGGQIEAQNNAAGGACFIVRLPVQTREADA